MIRQDRASLHFCYSRFSENEMTCTQYQKEDIVLLFLYTIPITLDQRALKYQNEPQSQWQNYDFFFTIFI